MASADLFLARIGQEHQAHLPRLLARLDRDEQSRAAQFVFDRDRRTYAAAHALLRFALDRAAGPHAWRFQTDAYGKPWLDPPRDEPRFSLSHTEGLVAVALATGGDVGVDVEPMHREPDEAALASLALSSEEVADLDRAADRRARLLQLWVAKEAIAKAAGLGLSLPLRQVVLRGQPLRLLAMPDPYGPASAWWVRVEQDGVHWVGLAMRSAPRRVGRSEVSIAQLLGR